MTDFLSDEMIEKAITESANWDDNDLHAELEALSLESTSYSSSQITSPKPNSQNYSLPVQPIMDLKSFLEPSQVQEVDLSLPSELNFDDAELEKEYASLGGVPAQVQSAHTLENLNDTDAHINVDEVDEDTIIRNCTNFSIAKQTALRYQREGNSSSALKWYRRMNELKSSQESLPVKPPKPSSNTVKQANSSKPSGLDESFAVLEEALTNAQNQYLAEAKRLRDSNPKEAVIKMKQFKYYNQELAVLKSRRNLPGCIPPTFHWETKLIESKIENLDVGDDQMKLVLDGIYGIDPNLASSSLSLNYYIGYLTSTDEALATGSIPSIKFNKELNSLLSFQASLNIIKRGKISQSSFSRKKAKFELIKSSLFSKKVVAVAIIPFSDLSSKCEIGGDIPLAEDDRAKSKHIGGSLRIRLRLRNPLGGIEKVVKEERVLVVNQWPDPTTNLVNESLDAISNVLSASSLSAATSNTTAPLKGTPTNVDLTEREKNDPLSVEFLESNDVIEQEIALIEKDLAGNLDDTDKLVQSIKLRALQSKLGLLQHQVGEGILTLEAYLERLRDRVLRDQAIFQYFVKNGSSSSVASKIQARISVMTAEIKGAEENLVE